MISIMIDRKMLKSYIKKVENPSKLPAHDDNLQILQSGEQSFDFLYPMEHNKIHMKYQIA